jgi:hypothetical protein
MDTTDTGFGANPIFLIVVTLFLIAAYFYWRKLVKEQSARKAKEHDARSHIVNDSNYNIAREGIDGHRTQELNEAEAKEVLEKLKASDDMPSREEFHQLREDLKES